jgi:hypothetical protein
MSQPFDIRKALGLGTEDIDPSVLGQPFLQIVQSGSPEIKKSHPKYAERSIPDAREGDIVSVQERKVLPQPLTVIPLAQNTLYTEWKPREQGGGFVGNVPLSITGHRSYRKGAANTPDANKEWFGEHELKLTVLFSVLYQDGSEWKKGLISMASTQLKVARRWAKALLSVRYPELPDALPPIFASKWLLSTGAEDNAKGDWMGWTVTQGDLLDLSTDSALLEQAFRQHTEEALRLRGAVEQAALPAASADSEDESPY